MEIDGALWAPPAIAFLHRIAIACLVHSLHPGVQERGQQQLPVSPSPTARSARVPARMSLSYSTGVSAAAEFPKRLIGPGKGKSLPTTIERQIAMLRAVPREPLRRTVSELVQNLCDEGHDVTTRSEENTTELPSLLRH